MIDPARRLARRLSVAFCVLALASSAAVLAHELPRVREILAAGGARVP